jgi:osmoprotectant transport system ATP-binding protein
MTVTTPHASGRKRGSAIRLENVVKQYPNSLRPAVAGVSLEIDPGEFIVLLGPSGCGKTTLLKMVNRIYEPTSGRIYIDGKEVHDLPTEQLRRGIGYVIQQTGLFPHMRIRDNVAVVPRLMKWNKHRIEQQTTDLLNLVGLPAEDYASRYPNQLSGGEQQRVGLARAMAAEPSMMLMDEPFGALDAITRARLQEEIRSIHRQFRQTILFVTHDIDEAVRLADRIVVMREGHVVQFGTPLEIVSSPADSFVSDLVGADDVMRRLGLLPVTAAVQPIGATKLNGESSIEDSAFLRDALGKLVESGHRKLVVVDNNQQPVGIVTLESLQAAASGGSHALSRATS